MKTPQYLSKQLSFQLFTKKPSHTQTNRQNSTFYTQVAEKFGDMTRSRIIRSHQLPNKKNISNRLIKELCQYSTGLKSPQSSTRKKFSLNSRPNLIQLKRQQNYRFKMRLKKQLIKSEEKRQQIKLQVLNRAQEIRQSAQFGKKSVINWRKNYKDKGVHIFKEGLIKAKSELQRQTQSRRLQRNFNIWQRKLLKFNKKNDTATSFN